MNDALTCFRGTFRLDELTVFSNDSWALSVRPEQLTLGSLVLSSVRGALRFEDLRPNDGSSLTDALSRTERVAREQYGAVRINVICLMMKDPVVHFHVLPRYDRLVEHHGRIWHDQDWPGPPVFRKVETPDATLHLMTAQLREACRAFADA